MEATCSSERRFLSEPQGAMSQKTTFFIDTTLKLPYKTVTTVFLVHNRYLATAVSLAPQFLLWDIRHIIFRNVAYMFKKATIFVFLRPIWITPNFDIVMFVNSGHRPQVPNMNKMSPVIQVPGKRTCRATGWRRASSDRLELRGWKRVLPSIRLDEPSPITLLPGVCNIMSNKRLTCKIWGLRGGDHEECRLLGHKNPIHTSPETHYVSATELSRLMLCKIWGLHGGDYDECRLLGYKNPVRTSQETH
jgi:hypothetical protein